MMTAVMCSVRPLEYDQENQTIVLLMIAAALYQFNLVKESIEREYDRLYKAGLYSEMPPVGSLEKFRVRLDAALINRI